MNADGSGKRNLTRNPGNDGPRLGPAWSPDGRKITFVSDRDGTYEVYVMNADGSGQRRLTHRGSDLSSPQTRPLPDSSPGEAEAEVEKIGRDE